MKSNEFRIGNLVNCYLGAPISESIESVIDVSILSYIEDGNNEKKVNYLPIPLTEDWLIKFGFDNLGEYGWGIAYFHIRFRKIHGFYFTIENRIIRINHIHQLQNLYFALTGEELELK